MGIRNKVCSQGFVSTDVGVSPSSFSIDFLTGSNHFLKASANGNITSVSVSEIQSRIDMQNVSTTGDTWNGTSRFVCLNDQSIGISGTFYLPLLQLRQHLIQLLQLFQLIGKKID